MPHHLLPYHTHAMYLDDPPLEVLGEVVFDYLA
jgi:hypothetical protein